jgi:hypothetical protein
MLQLLHVMYGLLLQLLLQHSKLLQHLPVLQL